jgi:hypothetical protein
MDFESHWYVHRNDSQFSGTPKREAGGNSPFGPIYPTFLLRSGRFEGFRVQRSERIFHSLLSAKARDDRAEL